MNNKIDYYKKSLEEISTFGTRKPTILVHSCCGPCATFPLKFLSEFFNVTIIYNNSNIYPFAEHQKRLGELEKLLLIMKEEQGIEIKVIKVKYDNDAFNKDLEPNADDPEGKTRCFTCFKKRMEEGFAIASELGFDYFTTIMTISSRKDSQVLNQIGESLQIKYPKVKYFYSDFKKNHGLETGIALCKKYCLYRQNYCGCLYSFRDMLSRENLEQIQK